MTKLMKLKRHDIFYTREKNVYKVVTTLQKLNINNIACFCIWAKNNIIVSSRQPFLCVLLRIYCCSFNKYLFTEIKIARMVES